MQRLAVADMAARQASESVCLQARLAIVEAEERRGAIKCPRQLLKKSCGSSPETFRALHTQK